MTAAKNWFEVDRKGLAKLIERRGKIWLLHELIANAWDAEGVTNVEVFLEPEEGRPLVNVLVRDDAPGGFADLRHAWTLFAESTRKGQAQKRGRFDIGEKLVLAMCDEASIVSTHDAVMFDGRGRVPMKARRPRGTEFFGLARITRAELAEIRGGLGRLIPPTGVATFIDGVRLQPRPPIKTFQATLPTELANEEEGILRRVARRCDVGIHEIRPGETAMLYEMGIPVVEIDSRWHVNIQQKVPLSMERDNVTPAYLRDIYVLVANALSDRLTVEDAGSTLVAIALADENATPETVNRVLDLRYSEKRAVWDPSDHEANMLLVSRGYTLIKGAQLTKRQWQNVKKYGAARPSGQIAPTKKALFSSDGRDVWVPCDKWTPAMRGVVDYCADICGELLDTRVSVSILSDITLGYAACFGDQGLVFNLGRLGHAFFDACIHVDCNLRSSVRPTTQLNQLIIHELGHHYAPNHLSAEYHEALCRLGARMTQLALLKPRLFHRELNAL